MIADDEPEMVIIVAMRLRANGYQVITAHDGAQAVELAHQERPDLIILDIKMPDKDGYAVLEELKASADTMPIPVIFFSALPPEQAREKAIQLNVDGFVSKSADPDEILGKIRRIFAECEEHRSTLAESSILLDGS